MADVPPFVDAHGEWWIGSYDTDEEDAIAEDSDETQAAEPH